MFKERFARAKGIFSPKDQEKIQGTRIAVAGLGLGGSIFINLVRMGFEDFHIADPDIYERTNINRQRLAKESTVGIRKDEALIKEALDINPDVKIKSFPEGVKPNNVDAFLEGVDWVVDVVDVFAIPDKLMLNERARKLEIPVVSSGSVGFSASLVVFDKSTPSFKSVTGLSAQFDYSKNLGNFVKFIAPVLPGYMAEQVGLAAEGKSHIPFVVPGVEISAAFVASEITKYIVGMGEMVKAPFGVHIDPIELNIEIYHAQYNRTGYGEEKSWRAA